MATFKIDPSSYGLNITSVSSSNGTIPSFTFPVNSGSVQELNMVSSYAGTCFWTIGVSGTRTPATNKTIFFKVNGTTVDTNNIISDGVQTFYFQTGSISLTDNIILGFDVGVTTTTTSSSTTVTTTTTTTSSSTPVTTTTTSGGGGSTSFKKKYYYSFGSNNLVSYTVELWQDTTSTVTSENIIADEIPFKVTYPTVSTKFDAVRGSGCDITLLSTTSMKFLNLYTTDMLEYQIRFFQGSNLLWVGYLDSELYSEPFAEKDNYQVALTGNDGLALLERMEYRNEDGINYSGITSNWTIITNILSKLKIEWNNIYVALSTTSWEITIGDGQSILTETYSNNDNYYDEDNVPMNCREVIETILAPFAAYIQIINANVYITDIDFIYYSVDYMLKYNSSFDYVSTDQIDMELGDLGEQPFPTKRLRFASDTQTFNILSPINKQKIISSPYHIDKILEYITDEDVFTGNTITNSIGSVPYTYTEKVNSESNYWLKYTAGDTVYEKCRFAELTGTNDNEGITEKYLVINNDAFYPDEVYPDLFTYKLKLPYFINSLYIFYLKFEAKVYVRTTDNMGDVSLQNVKYANIAIKLSIDDKMKFINSENSEFVGIKLWIDNTADGIYNWSCMDVSEADGIYTYNSIADTWVNLNGGSNIITSVKKPFVDADFVSFYHGSSTLNSGNLKLTISSAKVFNQSDEDITNLIKDVRIKDLKITLVDSSYNVIKTDDIEYISYVNKNVKNDGEDITLKLCSNDSSAPFSRGGILGLLNINDNGVYKSIYYYIRTMFRNGIGTLEELLANTIVSNYVNKTIELQNTINLIPSIFGHITYNTYLPDKRFMIAGAVIDYYEDIIELNLQEISNVSLNIQKNY